jgi:hypothetical protein
MNTIKKIIILCGVVSLCACASLPVTPKTVDQAAVILCDTFFAQQKPGLSLKDVEADFCTAATDIAPFLAAANSAKENAGAIRLHRVEVVGDAGAAD